MWRSPEIEIVPDWQVVWWDTQTESQMLGSPTGTWDKDHIPARYEQRLIQNIYGRPVHKDCGGEIQFAKKQEGCGNFQVRVLCLKCGKLFCADI